MSELFQDLAKLDKLIHEPARLSILTALMSCKRADFLFLQRLTGLTAGNLSAHIARLEEAGLVASEKRFIDRRPNTLLALSAEGRAVIETYWRKVEEVSRSVSDFPKENRKKLG